MTLRDRLADLIRRDGAMPVSRYMQACLHDSEDGYYATRPNLGEFGDFITAPLVSQIFGELLGLWSVQVWLDLGRPERCRLVEMGPGNGVMMTDVLRAARVAPGFGSACDPWLVETSEPLRRRQEEALAGPATPASATPRWVARLEDVPGDAPVILLANEFLDCLPIDQAVRAPDGWRQRRVGVDSRGGLAFRLGDRSETPAPPVGTVPVGTVIEWSDALRAFGGVVGATVSRRGGAALFLDYGRDGPAYGDTLQALRGGRKEDPLAHPGEADLTAHVDFPAFLSAARAAGAKTTPIRTQGEFLTALGARRRADSLARARPDRAGAIGRQLRRLIEPDQMGTLFKAAAVHAPGLAPPGFEGAS